MGSRGAGTLEMMEPVHKRHPTSLHSEVALPSGSRIPGQSALQKTPLSWLLHGGIR